MRLITIQGENQEYAGILIKDKVIPVSSINQMFSEKEPWPTTILDIINSGKLQSMNDWLSRKDTEALVQQASGVKDMSEIKAGPLYRRPSKIWGIGLNYVEHASDLKETAPTTEPASFMKPATTIIGPEEEINIPHQSHRTTAEAELGIIIGKRCKDVEESNALDVVAGYTTIIDMTAEDILEKNPRYLTRSKSFDTFFSFGPVLVTPDEIEDLHQLEVATVINGSIHRKNVVSNMTFKPEMLVSFHSKVMTLEPGDILSTGTPGAVVINDKDRVGCQIEGFPTLNNPVKDLKKQ